jgi:hypothetical protein
LGPEDHVPMIGKEAIGQDAHGAGYQRFLDNPFKRQKVLVLQEQPHSPNASIQDVKNGATWSNPRYSWHASQLTSSHPHRQ